MTNTNTTVPTTTARRAYLLGVAIVAALYLLAATAFGQPPAALPLAPQPGVPQAVPDTELNDAYLHGRKVADYESLFFSSEAFAPKGKAKEAAVATSKELKAKIVSADLAAKNGLKALRTAVAAIDTEFVGKYGETRAALAKSTKLAALRLNAPAAFKVGGKSSVEIAFQMGRITGRMEAFERLSSGVLAASSSKDEGKAFITALRKAIAESETAMSGNEKGVEVAEKALKAAYVTYLAAHNRYRPFAKAGVFYTEGVFRDYPETPGDRAPKK